MKSDFVDSNIYYTGGQSGEKIRLC